MLLQADFSKGLGWPSQPRRSALRCKNAERRRCTAPMLINGVDSISDSWFHESNTLTPELSEISNGDHSRNADLPLGPGPAQLNTSTPILI